MVDELSINQVAVLFRRLDPISQAHALRELVGYLPDNFFGVSLASETGALAAAAHGLVAHINRCGALAAEQHNALRPEG